VTDFRMPSLGADMEAGTLVEWLVKPGDRVKRGDVVAVVETQKGAIEIEVFEEGTIEEILVALEAKVPVGTPLARIRTAGEVAPQAAAAQPLVAPVEPPAAQPQAERRAQVAPPPPAGAALAESGVDVRPISKRPRASPAARRLAIARRLDLTAISGTGPQGAIVYADVERAQARAPAPEKPHAAGIDLVAMRAAIAAAMARSKREIPHYYLEHRVDMTAAEAWLARANMARPPEGRLLMGALPIKAVALAIRRFPAFNGFYRDGAFEPAAAAHVGVAIAIRGGGLAAPALHETDKLPLDDLMSRLRDLVQRMRSGRIRGSEIADATITVSSLGERGVETLYGVIYPPQVAIIGVGKVVRRPWLDGDAVVPRSVVSITLAADHRVTDGHIGALFLAEIGKLLQEPEKL
jgi:pyruvate dehydrogenase E2 component (dihydrolipoamide acetyltransferase)